MARGLIGRILDDLWCGTFGEDPQRELMSDLEEVLEYLGGQWQVTPCPMTIENIEMKACDDLVAKLKPASE